MRTISDVRAAAKPHTAIALTLALLTGCHFEARVQSKPAQDAAEAMRCGHNGSVQQCPGEQP